MRSETDVVVVGAGAAGVGAGRALLEAGIDHLILEARNRVGGRALIIEARRGVGPLDLGCGWLHSATENPFVAVAEGLGLTVDRSQAPWAKGPCGIDLTREEHAAFVEAQSDLDERLAAIGDAAPDRPVSDFLEPGNRWNGLIDAVSTYYSGAETRFVSAADLDRYSDNGVNWRVREGYGQLIAAYAAGLPIELGCAVAAIDHSGTRLRIETAKGAVSARAAIVTLPSRLLAEERIRFAPALPEKAAAAAGLPLGVADKLYLALDGADDLGTESRAFGRTDRAETAAYVFRPLGRPAIECYFGGSLARDLERGGGAAAFLAFATAELVGLFGSSFARRIAPLPMHLWETDPLAGGSYSYASPGCADMRQALAEPMDGRLFFAGEATSRAAFSTAHGAYETGRRAAREAIAALERRPAQPLNSVPG